MWLVMCHVSCESVRDRKSETHSIKWNRAWSIGIGMASWHIQSVCAHMHAIASYTLSGRGKNEEKWLSSRIACTASINFIFSTVLSFGLHRFLITFHLLLAVFASLICCCLLFTHFTEINYSNHVRVHISFSMHQMVDQNSRKWIVMNRLLLPLVLAYSSIYIVVPCLTSIN